MSQVVRWPSVQKQVNRGYQHEDHQLEEIDGIKFPLYRREMQKKIKNFDELYRRRTSTVWKYINFHP